MESHWTTPHYIQRIRVGAFLRSFNIPKQVMHHRQVHTPHSLIFYFKWEQGIQDPHLLIDNHLPYLCKFGKKRTFCVTPSVESYFGITFLYLTRSLDWSLGFSYKTSTSNLIPLGSFGLHRSFLLFARLKESFFFSLTHHIKLIWLSHKSNSPDQGK